MQREDHVKTKGEDGHLQAKEASEWNLPCQHLDRGFLPPKLRSNTFLLFNSHILWYFVMEVLEN